jgi:DNA-binding XRE family transcriptional regulator
MDDQDWTPVVLNRRRGGANPTGLAAQADRAGRVKAEAKAAVSAASRAAGIERAAEEGRLKLKKVAAESRQALVQARLARKLSQDQADAAAMLPKHTFKGLEAGTTHPSPEVLRKIAREFHVDIKLE